MNHSIFSKVVSFFSKDTAQSVLAKYLEQNQLYNEDRYSHSPRNHMGECENLYFLLKIIVLNDFFLIYIDI